jgi:hypothetical protein
MKFKIICITVCFFLLILGCNKPNPLTDEQVKIASEQCEKAGGIIKIFNTPAVSRCDCEFK